MSLRINHNIASVNGHNNMMKADKNISKSLEKLSSGLRINRAADDAAGLIISEQMRAQISGLDQASKNSETAVSMVQTAEGALDEMNTLLNKSRQLALHAANDGANDQNQKIADQSELDNIILSITRIANNTQFGTKKLLDGTLEAKSNATVTGGTLGNANLDAVVNNLSEVKNLTAGTYTTWLTRAAAAGTVTQAGVTNKLAAFSGGNLTGNTAAASLVNSTTLDAGTYQVALRGTAGNVFLSTYTATQTATVNDTALSGSVTINGTAKAAGSIAGTDTIANSPTNVTNEVTTLNSTQITVGAAGGALAAGNTVVATSVLSTGKTYTLKVTDGTTSYTQTLAGDNATQLSQLVSNFNSKAANVTAGVTVSWTGAGAPAISFTGAGAKAGALGNGFWVELDDGTLTTSAYLDKTATGAGTTGTKTYTVQLVDASNNVRASYSSGAIAQDSTMTVNDLLSAFQSGATLTGPVTALSNVAMNGANGVIDFDVTVNGGTNANGYRIKISDGAGGVLTSNASTGSTGNNTMANMLTQFNTDLASAGIGATTSITAGPGGGFNLAVQNTLATGAASNGYSLRITNNTTSAVVDSVATSGGSDGTEVTAQVELRDGSGNVAAVLTGTAGANRATVTNAEVGITIDLKDTWAQNVASVGTAVGVSFAYTDSTVNKGAVFQIGANRDQTVAVSIASAKATDLGKNATNVTDPAATLDSLRTGAYLANGKAQEAISVIDKAINEVTVTRGKLGAVQSNTLESTLNSLRTTSENLVAAESSIRDVDFAQESAAFTRNQILIQASTAMLAQANQLPQNVLQLLRG